MLDMILSILPESQRDKAKAYVAWLGAVATIVVSVVPSVPDWLAVVTAVLTALGVYGVPNAPVERAPDTH